MLHAGAAPASLFRAPLGAPVLRFMKGGVLLPGCNLTGRCMRTIVDPRCATDIVTHRKRASEARTDHFANRRRSSRIVVDRKPPRITAESAIPTTRTCQTTRKGPTHFFPGVVTLRTSRPKKAAPINPSRDKKKPSQEVLPCTSLAIPRTGDAYPHFCSGA
jgi:hypothetical protein